MFAAMRRASSRVSAFGDLINECNDDLSAARSLVPNAQASFARNKDSGAVITATAILLLVTGSVRRFQNADATYLGINSGLAVESVWTLFIRPTTAHGGRRTY
jgi:hypothetical protein